ncbi:glyceraldehyde-3-phosphate dehydrogenase [Gammaproteobacteria bacterium]|nr:glyceraldehyde-3-phosphate dehydrogenase [Gammaproteobacteria bacterium]
MNENARNSLSQWMNQQSAAEQMIPLIGRLYRERGVLTQVNGRRLVSASTVEILNAHRYARHIDRPEQDPRQSLALLKIIDELNLGACRVDLARLMRKIEREAGGAVAGEALNEALRQELAPVVGTSIDALDEPRDVVLYGFGRIGRLLARLLIERLGSGNKLRLSAIVVRGGREGDLAKRASLLRRDSVHGTFNGSVVFNEDDNTLIANGAHIQVIYANAPEEVDYTAYGINNAIIVDNTGVWRDEAGLSRHLRCKGASKVLLTAPGKGDLKNIVYGANHESIDDSDTIVSAASCTTNAITPVLKVMDEAFGIVNGHVETVHSYTNDQNLIDNYHKGDRRGRSAAMNMVLTETGAASAVAKALPQLKGKLTGNSIRVPTPDVSIAVLNVNLERESSKDEVNTLLQKISRETPLGSQIGYTASKELVSSDLVGTQQTAIVDSVSTIVNGTSAVLYVWYDNEMGYSVQVVRVLQRMAGLQLSLYPPNDG